MASTNDIVKVTVTDVSAPSGGTGFDNLVILDYHTRTPERFRKYIDLESMQGDGFLTSDAAYIAAAQVFAQGIRPERIILARRTTIPDLQVDLTPAVANSTVYSVLINNVAVSITSGASATLAAIITDLTGAINTASAAAISGEPLFGIVATAQATEVRVRATVAGKWFSCVPVVPALLGAAQTHVNSGVENDLAALLQETKDWFGVTLTTSGAAEVLAADLWCFQNSRVQFAQTQDTKTYLSGTTDIASSLNSANRKSTHISYNKFPQMFEALVAGSIYLVSAPGATNPDLIELAGVQPSDELTQGQLDTLGLKNAAFAVTYGGIVRHRGNKLCSSGTKAARLAVARDLKWWVTELQALLLALLSYNGINKISYTVAGIAQIKAAIEGHIIRGINSGFLNPTGNKLVIPEFKDIPLQDKQDEILRNVRVYLNAAGAIGKIIVDVALS